MSKACAFTVGSAAAATKTTGTARADARIALASSSPEMLPRRPAPITTHDDLPAWKVLRYRSADVNMHTGNPCADTTRPRLRRTSGLSCTMSTTTSGIGILSERNKWAAARRRPVLEAKLMQRIGTISTPTRRRLVAVGQSFVLARHHDRGACLEGSRRSA